MEVAEATISGSCRNQPAAPGFGPCAARGAFSALGRGLISAIAVFVLTPACAQTAATNSSGPSQDPLMTLMLSQPKLDTSSPIVAEAYFDPPLTRPGGRVVYRISLNALRDTISWNGKLPPSKLNFRPGAVGQTMQMAGTNYQPRTSYNFHAVAPGEGRFNAPSFVMVVGGKSIRVPETFFISSNTGTSMPPQMLYLDVTPQRPFVGQATRVRILSPASPMGAVQALGQVQLTGDGFIHELTSSRQSVEVLPNQGRTLPHYIYETSLIPISAGVQRFHAQAFAMGNRFSGTVVITGPATISGSTMQYTLLDSDPVQLEFRPLPDQGRPAGFAGAVGFFSVEHPVLSTNVLRPGDPVKMTVSIRGKGNLGRLSLAEPPLLPEWQVFPAKHEKLPPQVLESRGYASFTYTLVPLKGQLEATPEIPFSYFDPDQEVYVTNNIPPVPVKVLPGQLPADLDVLLKQRMARLETEPVLSPLAKAPGMAVSSLTPLQLRGWFPAMQLAPAAFFLALWQWDRRRRYLEAHPEVVLRRQARKELRKERKKMRDAARRRDAESFQLHALRALQAAAAPNFPAEPGAVLSTDAAQYLSAPEHAEARRSVERLFESCNARFYAGQDARDLLSEHGRIEKALAILEERL